MRKIMLTAVATCAVVALIPATALAHGHGGRHHHARIHHRQFGHAWGQAGNTTPAGAAQDAGTVQSFTNGVLTIALANGQTVSGTVTPDTEIECRAPEMSGTSGTTGWRDHHQGDDDGPGDDDNGDFDNEGAQNCDTSALTAGAVVHEARLSVSGAGANWDKVELVTSSASATPSSASSSSSSSCGHQ
jgi:hypothetical protein